MKIHITTVHDKIGLITYINHQMQCGLVAAKGKVLDIIYNNKPLTIDISQFDIDKLNTLCTFNIINPMKQNQFEFKPFDKVLARHNDEDIWTPTLYGYTLMKNNEIRHICGNAFSFAQCIPYNENTARLIGTNLPYVPPKPKEWKVSNVRYSFDEKYTTEEFIEFIKNNDLLAFVVKRIKSDN